MDPANRGDILSDPSLGTSLSRDHQGYDDQPILGALGYLYTMNGLATRNDFHNRNCILFGPNRVATQRSPNRAAASLLGTWLRTSLHLSNSTPRTMQTDEVTHLYRRACRDRTIQQSIMKEASAGRSALHASDLYRRTTRI